MRRAGDLAVFEPLLGDVLLNDGAELDGLSLLIQDAVPGALPLVVADDGADQTHGIVIKEELPGLIELLFPEQGDGFGNIRMDGEPSIHIGFLHWRQQFTSAIIRCAIALLLSYLFSPRKTAGLQGGSVQPRCSFTRFLGRHS